MQRRTFVNLSAAAATAAVTLPLEGQTTNPLLEKWTTPFELPPFDRIKPEHFLPAYQTAITEELAEVDAIVATSAAPNFDNTIAALEKSGATMQRVGSVFSNLNQSNTNKELQAVARQTAPMLAKHRSTIYLNQGLFKRVEAVHASRSAAGLNPEQVRLVERYYKQFIRAGAQLDAAKKARLAEIDQTMASRTTQFAQNLLADTAAYELVLDKEADLAGLPESVRASAAETGKQRGKPGKWVFTLQRSSIEPFLQLSTRRDLREKAFKAWAARGDNENQYDNKALIREIVLLRMEKAQLLGHQTFAQYSLDDTMAKTPAAAKGLMEQLWKPAISTAQRETAELQAAMTADKQPGKLEAWDWRFYSEKVRLAKYNLDEEQLKPYFPLDRMIEASFWVASKLFGLNFTERTDLPKYHPDVRTWEVKRADGSLVGIFYGDYYARPTKASGAWASSFRRQQRLIGNITPVGVNNLNFNKPPAGQPALLSYDDATTLFHEFGHGLHGLLSNATYPSLAGTAVPRDFVEMPSQLYEHWMAENQVLEKFARHYKTGEVIPKQMLAKLKEARNFNQGFSMVEYLASALVDLEWHQIDKAQTIDVREMEAGWLKKYGMPREIIMRHRSPHFSHIFGSPTGYAAGYYSYRWSAVLDNDGFEAFTEKGDPFDPETAKRLYTYIYSAGGTEDPMELYKKFRGRTPTTDALMRSLGFN
jgi:peptidyl-dipeptidase Dcp